MMSKTTFQDLVDLMARLRAPDGCPWDREQTYATLAPMLIEEAYEVMEAAEAEDWAELRDEVARQPRDQAALAEEVGDLLFVVTNLARQLGVEPEVALKAANRKFRRRFRHVETRLDEQGKSFSQSSL